MLHEIKPWCSAVGLYSVQCTVYNSVLFTILGVHMCTVYSTQCRTVYCVQYEYTVYISLLCKVYGVY